MLTPDQQRVKELLCETITLLCKNGLHFESEFCIDALIGITLDQRDVFLVSIKETVKHGEVFIRERSQSVRSQTMETNRRSCAGKTPLENKVEVRRSISESHTTLRTQSDLDVRMLRETTMKEVEQDQTIEIESAPIRSSEMNSGLSVDEELKMKEESEAFDEERDKGNEDHLTTTDDNIAKTNFDNDARALISSALNKISNSTASIADKEKVNNLSSATEMSKTQLEEMMADNMTVQYREEEEEMVENKNDNSIVDNNSSVMMSCTSYDLDLLPQQDKYYNQLVVEKKTVEAGEDANKKMNEEADESDGDEPVVVKVEPPSSDYTDDPHFSSSSGYHHSLQMNGGRNFIPDVAGFPSYHRSKNMIPDFRGKRSQTLPSFDYSGLMADTNTGYNQFTTNFQLSGYSMKHGMNQTGSQSSDTSQSPHMSASMDKQQLKMKQITHSMPKPYSRLDYNPNPMNTSDTDQIFKMSDANNMTDSEMSGQTDVDKYVEMQNSFGMNRRARSTFTTYQLQRLENEFKCAHYVDAATRSKLADELNLSDSIVLVWFQNRRQKFKKQLQQNLN